MNLASLRNALGQVAQGAVQVAQQAADLGQQLTGARCLRDYIVEKQTGTAGFGSAWKIFSARARKEGAPYPNVSVWIFEKRVGTGGDYLQSGDAQQVVEFAKRECAALAKFKHPSIVTVIEPMEETRNQLVMVTEPIFASVRDTLTHFKGLPPAVVEERANVVLSKLELKIGLLQVADAMQHLHTVANMVHRGVCPETMMITSSGTWKLGGLALATSIQLTATPGNPSPIFLPSIEGSWPPRLQYLQPALAYMAPEIVMGDTSTAAPSADIFSFGALVYEVLSGLQLLPVATSVSNYKGKLASLHLMDLSAVPPPLHNMLRSMLSPVASTRPPAIAFMAAQFFQEDKVVRAMRLLETLPSRSSEQRALLLMDLGTPEIWGGLDARVLRLKVLPALLAEARNLPLQPLSLPLILRILALKPDQDSADLPAMLAPVLSSVSGEGLLLLLRGVDTLTAIFPQPAIEQLILPLFVRAADAGDARLHDEMLAHLPAVARKCSPAALEPEVCPRVHKLCLSTTNGAVRCRGFKTLGEMVGSMHQGHGLQSLHTLRQVTSVDHTPATVSAAVQMAEAVAAKFPGLLAGAVLPSLMPLLGVPTLEPALFQTIMRDVRKGLAQLEKDRGLPPQSSSQGLNPPTTQAHDSRPAAPLSDAPLYASLTPGSSSAQRSNPSLAHAPQASSSSASPATLGLQPAGGTPQMPSGWGEATVPALAAPPAWGLAQGVAGVTGAASPMDFGPVDFGNGPMDFDFSSGVGTGGLSFGVKAEGVSSGMRDGGMASGRGSSGMSGVNIGMSPGSGMSSGMGMSGMSGMNIGMSSGTTVGTPCGIGVGGMIPGGELGMSSGIGVGGMSPGMGGMGLGGMGGARGGSGLSSRQAIGGIGPSLSPQGSLKVPVLKPPPPAGQGTTFAQPHIGGKAGGAASGHSSARDPFDFGPPQQPSSFDTGSLI